MAFSSSFTIACTVSDGIGGQQSFSFGSSTIVPTKPAFCGSGTATVTPAAISYGSVTTPKALLILNDGAVEITVDVGTDTYDLGVTGSTTKLPFAIVTRFAAAPEVSTASSTAAYRTFIME